MNEETERIHRTTEPDSSRPDRKRADRNTCRFRRHCRRGGIDYPRRIRSKQLHNYENNKEWMKEST